MHQPANLKYFREVARTGCIRQAAEHLNVAASAVSRQIANLEGEVGLPLLERRPRGVVLTPAGEVLVGFAQKMLSEYDALRRELNALRDTTRGCIRIAAIEGVVDDLIPCVMDSFRRVAPNVTFNLTVACTDEVTTGVRRGTCDVGFAFCAEPDDGVATPLRISAPLLAVTVPGHPLAQLGRPVALRDLLPFSVALPDESLGLRRLIDERCAHERLGLRPVLSTNSIQAVRSFARRGGVALLPTVTISHDLASGQVVGSPLADAALASTTIAVCIPASGRLSPASRDFLSHLDQALAAGLLEE